MKRQDVALNAKELEVLIQLVIDRDDWNNERLLERLVENHAMLVSLGGESQESIN